MNHFETTITVAEKGQIVVPGVPFEPGTEVVVTIRLKEPSRQELRPYAEQPDGIHSGLRWEGNVLVHQGIGTSPLVSELRDERLDQLGAG
jgi:hypothetical protein